MTSTVCCAFFVLFLLLPSPADSDHASGKGRTGDNIDVGVILDLGTSFGIVSNYCVAMAAEDILHEAAGLAHHTPRLALHVRHSATGDHMGSANAVHDLVHNVGVQAIIGSQLTSDQSAFLGYMSGHAHIPFISLATSRQFMSSNPYMLGIDTRDISQARAIAAVVKAYKWEEVTLLHDNTNGGTNLISLLTHDLHETGLKTIHQRVITPSPSMNIHGTLQEVAALSTKVFIIHTSFSLASEIFKQARILGMMSDGYAWIITSEIANRLNYMDRATMDSMQGVLGLRNEVPKSAPLSDFEIRWKRKIKREQPEVDVSELDVYALLAYDAIHFLAKSAQRENVLTHNYIENSNSYGLEEPSIGRMLIDSMLSTEIRGLTGELRVVGGQFLMSEVFEIVNIAGKSERPIGYWTQELGLCRDLNAATKRSHYSNDAKDLAGAIWPGGVVLSPRRRITETKLVVGYPMKDGFNEYVKEEGPGQPIGFSIDVFKYVMNELAIEFEWKVYGLIGDRHNYYDRLVQQAEDKTYGAIAGDVTITASRAEKVDFSHPYADSDVAMIVLAEDENDTNNPTWFLKPMSIPLWGATFGILLLKGFLVWFFEYRSNNQEFHGTYDKKLGKILALSFSSFIFADSDKLKRNYSRIIVILWTVLSFILVTGYTANLTSMLTVQRLLPKVKDLQSLIDAGEWIGYQSGSFVEGYLKCLGAKHLRPYSTDVEYVQALTNKSVVAIVDEMPYIRVFLGLHPNFAIVDRINHTGGLGFVFPKNSSLVPRVSQALLKLRESEDMCLIERKWFGNDTCSTAKQDASVSNSQLTLRSFIWLYILILSTAALTLIAFLLFARGSEQVGREGDNHDQRGQVAVVVGIPWQGDEGRVENAGRQEIQLGRMDDSFYESAPESDNISEQPLNSASTPGVSPPNQSVSSTSRGMIFTNAIIETQLCTRQWQHAQLALTKNTQTAHNKTESTPFWVMLTLWVTAAVH